MEKQIWPQATRQGNVIAKKKKTVEGSKVWVQKGSADCIFLARSRRRLRCWLVRRWKQEREEWVSSAWHCPVPKQGGCFSTVRQNGGNSKFLVSNAEQPFTKLSYQIFHASAHKLNKNKRFTRVSSVGEAAGVGAKAGLKGQRLKIFVAQSETQQPEHEAAKKSLKRLKIHGPYCPYYSRWNLLAFPSLFSLALFPLSLSLSAFCIFSVNAFPLSRRILSAPRKYRGKIPYHTYIQRGLVTFRILLPDAR